MNRPLILGVVAATAATPAAARDRKVEVHPYIEVGQVLTADLDSSDVLTYTSVAAGIDATIQTRRVEVQLSYKYERRIDWADRVADQDVHSGLARAAVEVARGVTIEAGALATRARSDIRGDAPGVLAGNVRNIDQVYSAYVGPTLETRAGPVTVNAAYRFGYTKVEGSSTDQGLPAGQRRLDSFDDSTSQLAVASAGVRAGTVLPVGLTVSGAWQREDAGQLDQRYDGKYARADAVLPVTQELAVTAGAGYEKIEISQRDPVVDAGGDAVTDGNGRYVTDAASPRRIAYDTDGLFWDVGVVWRPSHRTTLEARAGRRYDTMSYTGSLSYQLTADSGLQVGVYDSIQSFGRGLNKALSTLPTSFVATADPFSNQFGGCTFGTQGNAVGSCLTPILSAITTANFRARGIDTVFVVNRGRDRFGIGGGYTNHEFLVPDASPGFNLSGVTDEIYYAQIFAGRALSRRSNVEVNGFINYFDSGIANAPDTLGAGATGSYTYSFGSFGATASLGLYAFDQDGGDSDTSAQALIGMRYTF